MPTEIHWMASGKASWNSLSERASGYVRVELEKLVTDC